MRKGKGVGGAEQSECELVNKRKMKIEKSGEKSKESIRKYPRGKKENMLRELTCLRPDLQRYLETCGAFGKGGAVTRRLEMNSHELHAPQTSNTLLHDISIKPRA